MNVIETKCDGFNFRSRLEARWYIFFKTIGVTVMYEPEGFVLNGTPYLPDFFVPEQPTFPKPLWIEIKGVAQPEDFKLLEWLVLESGIRATMLGDIPNPAANDLLSTEVTEIARFEKEEGQPSGFWGDVQNETHYIGADYGYLFCQCPMCLKYGFEFNGRSARIQCGCDHSDIANGDKTYNYDSHDLMRAYDTARGYRF